MVLTFVVSWREIVKRSVKLSSGMLCTVAQAVDCTKISSPVLGSERIQPNLVCALGEGLS